MYGERRAEMDRWYGVDSDIMVMEIDGYGERGQ